MFAIMIVVHTIMNHFSLRSALFFAGGSVIYGLVIGMVEQRRKTARDQQRCSKPVRPQGWVG